MLYAMVHYLFPAIDAYLENEVRYLPDMYRGIFLARIELVIDTMAKLEE